MDTNTLPKISDGNLLYDRSSRSYMLRKDGGWVPYDAEIITIVLCARYGLSRARHKRRPSEVDLAMKEVRTKWRRKFKRPQMWLEGTMFCISGWELIDEHTN